MTTTNTDPTLLQELRYTLVRACRILYAEGVMEGPTGHISARVPNSSRMLIKPVMVGFEEITEEEFILMDFNGEKLAGGGPVGQVPGEFHIHSEIYRARPDVASVVHTHPLYTVALSASGQTPRAYNLEGRQFASGVPLFDAITDAITTPEMGQAVVRTLGQTLAVVLKCHGVAVGGSSIQEACLRNVSLEEAARMHLLANQAGTPTALGPAEGTFLGSPEVRRARAQPTWDYFVRRSERILSNGR